MITDTLKVKFDFTVADLADVAYREANRSGSLSSRERNARILGLAVWAVILYAVTEATPWSVHDRVIVAAFFFALSLLFMLIPRTSPAAKRLLKLYRDKLGSDGPFPCEVELGPEGVVIRQFGGETKRDWSHVQSVDDARDGIEFRFAPIGFLLVRNHGFSTPEARRHFLDAARHHFTAASGGHEKSPAHSP